MGSQDVTNKCTVREHAQCRAEFHQYGYDPYDSESATVWWYVTNALQGEPLQ